MSASAAALSPIQKRKHAETVQQALHSQFRLHESQTSLMNDR